MDNKKTNIIIAIILILLILLILWISGIIPRQIAKIYSINYIKNNFSQAQLEYSNIIWDSYLGEYVIEFKDKNNETYSFTIGPKYFPINFGQRIIEFEEEYKQEYIEQKEITDLNIFYSQKVTKQYKDIRTLSKDYSIQSAQKDNCFVIGAMVHNDNLYNEFMDKYNKNESAFIRVAQSTIEGDVFLIDILYDSRKQNIYLVKDDTRDKFSAIENQKITLKTYEKTGVWKYQGSEYWVAYNGELPDGEIAQYSINYDKLFIIATIN